mmetsp:Transcript_14092/g.16342  ORF Transcript_14092/g.16342 Transcript_14092/m.16342 type:complete len:143 (+) Transcript_14092:117-545(+)
MLNPDSEQVPLIISLRVEDNGPGISEENLGKLFVNFGTLSEHEQNNPQGTGLGLSICKLLAHKMNGSVYAESELGRGTSFIFTFSTHCILKDGDKGFGCNKKAGLLEDISADANGERPSDRRDVEPQKHKRMSALVADDEPY